MADFWHKLTNWILPKGGEEHRLICTEIFDSLSILSDGSVTCSCADIFEGHVLGNIKDTAIREIFDNERYRELRRRMISGDLPPQCRSCLLRIRPRTGRETVEAGPITWLQIDPIFGCNLRCPDCALTEMHEKNYFIRPRSALSLEAFQGIIDQTASTLRHIRYHMLGEPFLNRQAGDMLSYARNKVPGLFISIETNGLLVGAEVRRVLVQARVDYVKFSIDGASQETYAQYRVGGEFQQAYDNMAALVKERNAAGADRPRVIWQYILFKWNDADEEIRRAQRLAKEASVDHLYWLITHSSGASERFRAVGDYPIFKGEGQSLNETTELAGRRGEPMLRPAPNLKEYDPWK